MVVLQTWLLRMDASIARPISVGARLGCCEHLQRCSSQLTSCQPRARTPKKRGHRGARNQRHRWLHVLCEHPKEFGNKRFGSLLNVLQMRVRFDKRFEVS